MILVRFQGTDENQLAATGNELTDQPNNSTQLADSSPLTRDRGTVILIFN